MWLHVPDNPGCFEVNPAGVSKQPAHRPWHTQRVFPCQHTASHRVVVGCHNVAIRRICYAGVHNQLAAEAEQERQPGMPLLSG